MTLLKLFLHEADSKKETRERILLGSYQASLQLLEHLIKILLFVSQH